MDSTRLAALVKVADRRSQKYASQLLSGRRETSALELQCMKLEAYVSEYGAVLTDTTPTLAGRLGHRTTHLHTLQRQLVELHNALAERGAGLDTLESHCRRLYASTAALEQAFVRALAAEGRAADKRHWSDVEQLQAVAAQDAGGTFLRRQEST